MILIWTGLGWLVPLVTFGCLLASELIVEGISGNDYFYQAHGWPKLVPCLIAASIWWPLGRALEGKVKIDPDTGVARKTRNNHTFFFIPIKWWALLCVGLGIALLFAVG